MQKSSPATPVEQGYATLPQELMQALRGLDTCLASNAVERLQVRPRNEGFVHDVVQCRFPQLGPMLGHAVTGRIRSTAPPIAGGWYYDHMDWWRYVASVPEPRVIVIEDIDPEPGAGAWFGEIHGAIGRALGCVGYISNGSVRDLEAVEAMGIQLFSASVAVSHAYAHIVDFGEPIDIGRLRICPGDLLHGDRHGVHTIPIAVAARIPQIAARLREQERRLLDFCNSAEFSLEGLATNFRDLQMPSTDEL